MLQWGRTREGAEGLLTTNALCGLVLQWGRTREGAEGRHSEPPAAQTHPQLQWGRTREGAEGLRNTIQRATNCNRFSGAASVKVWKDLVVFDSLCDILKFQWGRTREGAEGSLRSLTGRVLRRGFSGAAPVKVRKGAHDCVAVCGCCVGFSGAAPVKVRKVFERVAVHPPLSMLQWGRTREGAEGIDDCSLRKNAPVLQWGRTREGAEGYNPKTDE